MKLPYLGILSHILERKILRIVHNNYSTEITSRVTIGNVFKFKARIPKPLCSSIVYKFSCDNCNAIYVGKASRNLFMRMEEQRGFL